jgi:hypothetical protein
MIGSAREHPIDELEVAHEHVEILLTEYADMLSGQLSALLSALHSDLAALIDDHYGVTPANGSVG